jgi:POT family proton-dependent oligopeptide transporter
MVERPKLALSEIKTVAVLVALVPVLAITAVGNQQIGNAYLVWGDKHLDLEFFGQSMPVTWLVSLDAFIASITIVLTVAFWRWWATWRTEPNEITKLWIGAVMAAFAPLFLGLASLQEAATGHKAGLAWALAFHIVNDFGYSNIFPVGLALFSRAAPKSVAGLMIGVYFLHLFTGNMLVGWLGGLLEKMPAASFWFLHAGLVAAGAVVLLAFGLVFGKTLAPLRAEPD